MLSLLHNVLLPIPTSPKHVTFTKEAVKVTLVILNHQELHYHIDARLLRRKHKTIILMK